VRVCKDGPGGSATSRECSFTRNRLLAGLLFALAVGLLLNNGLLTGLVKGDAYAFAAMYLAGRGAQERADFYSHETMARLAQRARTPRVAFVYPPLAAIFFLPLSLLPFWLATRVWLLINLGCLALVAYFLGSHYLEGLDREQRFLWAGAGAALLAGYHSIAHILQVGQATLVVAVFLLGALRLARRDRDLAAGVVLALGTFFKPAVAILPFYLLLKGRWRLIGFWLGAMALGAAISLALFGTEMHINWLRCFGEHNALPDYWVSFQDAVAFWGRLFKWEGIAPFPQYAYLAGPLTTATQIILLLPVLPLLLMRRWQQLTERRLLAEVSLLILVAIIASNLTGIHIHFLLTFGLAAALAYVREDWRERQGSWYLTAVWVSAYCLLALPFQYRAPELQHGILVLAISSKFYGGVILWGLLVYLLARDRGMAPPPTQEAPVPQVMVR